MNRFATTLLVLVAVVLMGATALAQPGAISTNNLVGAATYDCTVLTDAGAFRQARILAGTSSASVSWEFPATCAFPGDVWRPYSSGSAAVAFNAILAPNGGTNTGALYNSGNGGSSGVLASTTSGNYYTFNVEEVSSPTNANMNVLETTFNPVTIATVSHLPVIPAHNQSVTVTITTSVAPAVGENVYVRYSTDGYVTSTIVLATFVGTTGTAVIPGNAGGTSVSYYVYSSNATSGTIGTDVTTFGQTAHNLWTLNLNNNGGTNYGYTVHVQLTGTKTIPGDYATIKAAVDTLNAYGVGTGGVVFNVAAGHTETNSEIILRDSTSTSSNTITFQKSGSGANPKVNAGVGVSTTLDGIIKIAGTDYVTFDSIDVAENAANLTATTQMEWGYAVLKGSPTNGSQNVTIKNCTITMIKTNTPTYGIYHNNHSATSTTAYTVTSTAGANSNNKYYGNTISNTYNAIILNGFADVTPFTFYDQNNEIGVTAGNVITNFGGGSTTMRPIEAVRQNNFKINNNNLNGGTGTTTTTRAIYLSTNTNSTGEINNNTITLASSATASQVTPIENNGLGGTGSSITIKKNVISSTYTTATSGTYSAIWNNNTSGATVVIDSNTINGVTVTGTGTVHGIRVADNGTNVVNVRANSISYMSKTGASGNLYAVDVGTATVTFAYNTIHGITIPSTSGTTSAVINGYRSFSSPLSETINNNLIDSLIVAGAGTSTSTLVRGIYTFTTAAATKQIYSNTINLLTSHIGGVTGIHNELGAPAQIYGNNVYNLQCGATGGVTIGINMVSGTTQYAYNNFVSDLRSPASTNATTGVVGLNIAGGTTASAWYNTVRLNAVSSGATFGTSGIFASTTPTVELRNNIVVNLSTPGATGGFVAAYRRSSTTLTSYAAASNTNDFYVDPTLGVRRYFYGQGATPADQDSTMAAFKARVTPRDGSSFAENPPFINAATTPYNLHMSTVTATQTESGGTPVTTPVAISTDYDGDSRNAGTPDVGADEFAGTGLDLSAPLISYTALAGTHLTSNRSLATTITDVSGVQRSPAGQPLAYYKKGAAGSYMSVTATEGPTGTFTFTIDHSLVSGVVTHDTIYYYVAAQDSVGNAGTNPSGSSPTINPPNATVAAPNFYKILPTLAAGTYSIGATPGPALNPPGMFATVKAFFDTLNASVLTGSVVGELISNTTETATAALNAVAYDAGGPYTVTLKPAAGSVDTVSGSLATSIIKLNGADYVTIDGSNSGGSDRSLTVINSSTGASSAAIWLGSTGAGAGAKNNTIKNTILRAGVDQTSSSTITFGVFIGSATAIGSAGADNDSNTISNNEVVKARYGVGLFGASAGNLDLFNRVIANTIGPASGGSDVIGKSGVTAVFQDGIQIANNEIRFVQGTGGTDRFGIALGSESVTQTSGSPGATVRNSSIFGNRIHDLSEVGTFSGVGIALTNTSAPPSANRVFNNMIWNVLSNGTSGDFTGGISVHNGDGDLVAHNSIYLSGDRDPGASTSASTPGYGVLVSSTSVLNPTIKNNIVWSSMSSNTATLMNYAIGIPASYSFGTGSSNYNDFFVTGAQNLVGIHGATNDTTLAQWKTGTTQDSASVSGDPMFISASNLHINTTVPSPVSNAGTPLLVVPTDIDGDTRHVSTPDIGADEYTAATPGAFTLTSPADGSIGQPVSGTLSWTSSAAATAYDVYLDGNPIPITIVSANQPGTSYAYTVPAGTYYWDVVAKNGNGSTSSSNGPFDFTTVVPPAAPSALTLALLGPVPPASSMSLVEIHKAFAELEERKATKAEFNALEDQMNGVTITSDGVSGIQLSFTDNAASGPNTEDSFYVYGKLGSAPAIGGHSSPDFLAALDSSSGSGGTVMYTHTPLNIDEHWYYKVTAKNGQGESAAASADTTTGAATPGTPTFSDVAWNRMKVYIDQNGNPATVTYAIHETSTNKYLAANGTLSSATAVWQTYAAWGGASGKLVTGLSRGTSYTFEVKARNSANVETAFGTSGSQATNYDQPLGSLSENFTQVAFPPAGWTLLDEVTVRWSRNTVSTQPDGLVGPMAKYDFFNASSGERDTLITPMLNLAGAIDASLNWSHSYRTYTSLDPDSVFVIISSDGGSTWSVLNADGYPNMATRAPSTSSAGPAAAGDWRENTVNIPSPYWGASTMIGWAAKSAFGNNYWLDDISVLKKANPDTLIVRKYEDIDGDFGTTGDRALKAWYLQVNKDSVGGTLIASGTTDSLYVTNLLDGTYVVTEADSAGSGWSVLGRVVNNTPVASTARYDTVVFSGGGLIHRVDFVNTTAPPPAPVFTANPSSMDLGNVLKNDTNTDTLYVKNTGNAAMSIDSAVAYGGEFSVTPNGPATIAVGDSAMYEVTFSPSVAGAQTGDVVFYSNTTTSPDSVSVAGTGIQAVFTVSPSSISFGGVQVGDSLMDMIYAINEGTSVLNITSITTSGPDFSMTPTGATLMPGESVLVVVYFHPVGPGAASGSLIFTHNGKTTPDSVSVSGVGFVPSFYLSLSPDSVFNEDPLKPGKSKKPVKRNKGLYPNWSNLLDEVNVQGGFAPGTTESDSAGGMLIGKSYMFNAGGSGPAAKWKADKESAKVHAWVRLAKWDFKKSIGKSFANIQKTLIDKNVGKHTGPASGFDTTTDGKNKPIFKQQTKLTPKKQSNKLFAELVALKVNIAASAMGKTPSGLGDLVFDTDGNFLDEMTILQIADTADQMMTLWQGHTQAEYDSLYSAVYNINRAFIGSLDTITFNMPDSLHPLGKLTLDGAVDVNTVPYLKVPSPFVVTRTYALNSEVESPEDFDFENEFEDEESATPAAVKLYQNYPNPFNPTTTIAFRLLESSVVTVRVFNMLGQEIATLVSGEEFDEGIQGVEFAADQLSSGVYFYRIDAQGLEDEGLRTVETRKMILMK